MSDRYFAKVVSVQDKFTVVINAGTAKDVKIGSKFLIVGLGELIIDPDTGEELERLEIIRGNAQAIHVQEKIATLKSNEYKKQADGREIKKVSTRGGLAVLGGVQDTITEITKPGEQVIRELQGVQVGDYVIAN